MHLIYIDDSMDGTNLPGTPRCVFSALAVPAERWREVFGLVKDFRRRIKQSDGIKVNKELHATEFIAGRGSLGDKIVPKRRRLELYAEALRLISNLPEVRLFNALSPRAEEYRIFERLLNRINRTMEAWNSHAMLICDEGKECIYTRMVRKMSVFNPIPSRYGVWRDTASSTRNIPIERIIEDPVFKDSKSSYFIQLADFCAFALLRREHPMASQQKYNFHRIFNILSESKILVREACRNNPEGIIEIRG
ncbi:MAG: DUF3800 domain-containing protein [Sedimentisphaerales bacterium]|nr:DUF3800 domain-containing protein [Sedimentisphaerales bacterium]